jgi:hypothetical protein
MVDLGMGMGVGTFLVVMVAVVVVGMIDNRTIRKYVLVFSRFGIGNFGLGIVGTAAIYTHDAISIDWIFNCSPSIISRDVLPHSQIP